MTKSSPASSPKSKSVKFSDFSGLLMFNDNRESRSRLNYSPTELDLLKVQATRDAQVMAMLIASPPLLSPEQIPTETMCRMIGIERIMPLNEARGMMIRRQNHIRAILSHQGCTADELRRISEESSRPARAMAQRLAAHYFVNLVV